MTTAWGSPVGVSDTESDLSASAPRGRVPVVTASVFVATGAATAAHLLAPTCWTRWYGSPTPSQRASGGGW